MHNLEDALKALQNLLPIARRKASRARQVMDQPGYVDYRKWITKETQVPRPDFNNFNPEKYTAECLFKAGMAYGATYFEGCLLDAKEIREQKARIEKELSEERDAFDFDEDE